MTITIIAAVATNRVIGNEGGIPWRLSDDLKQFRLMTMNQAVVMGRKTWDSVGRPLPGRDVIVMTRQPSWKVEGVQVCENISQVLQYVGDRDLFVAGGADIYKLFLPVADRLALTHVYGSPKGDILFPEVDWARYKSIAWEQRFVDVNNDHESSFEMYQKLS